MEKVFRMSKVQSLIKKAAVFEKLAKLGSRKEFLQSLAQMDPAAQQAAFMAAKKHADEAMEYAKKHTDLSSEVQAAFSALPMSSPNDAVALKDAASKFADFARKLYAQGKQESDNAKMVTANQVMYAANGIHSEVAKMKAAWPEPPEVKDAPTDVATDTKPTDKPTAKPAATSRLQTVKGQINYMNTLANGLAGKTGPAKTQALKQINGLVSALQAALKNTNWGEIKDYIIGRKLVTDALRSLYNDKLEYADLEFVPALDYGRGVPEAAY
jgi:hypothetical protein